MRRQGLYGFGRFELDAEQMVLRTEDGVVNLPPKALALLLALLEQRGEVVSKQQLMDTVWPESYVEEGNLTQNIFLLRRELGALPDGADYIQTLSKRGYRINASVELTDRPASVAGQPLLVVESGDALLDGSRPARGPGLDRVLDRVRFSARTIAFACGAMLCIVAATAAVLWRGDAHPRVSEYVQLTHDGITKRGHLGTSAGPDAALFTDGARVFFTEGTSDSLTLAEVSASGGETARISVPFNGPQLLDLSQDHSELLVSSQTDTAAPSALWKVPIPAGAARAIPGIHAWDASWSPDGRRLALASGRDLLIANPDGTEAKKIATLPGLAWMPRWSPDGRRLRLTVFNVRDGADSLWEVAQDGSGLQPILKDWSEGGEPTSVCCGSWTPDGRQFVFEARHGGRSEIWAVRDGHGWRDWFSRSAADPVQVTQGQLSSLAPVISPDGHKLFVIGQQLRGELQRFDHGTGQFVSYLGGQSMDFANVSLDGQWVTYVDYPSRTLWRSRTDGSDRLQLTFAPLHAMMPRWSPDGRQIVFFAAGGGKYQRAVIIAADGGPLKPLASGEEKEMLPNWSPDGTSVLYSEFPFFAVTPGKIAVHLLNLKTQQSETLPGSEGLFAAQWSPDGRYVAAGALQGQKIELFDFETRVWTEVARGTGFLIWSRDTKYLYFLRDGQSPAVMRLRLSDRTVEEVASLKGVREAGQLAGIEFGLTPEGDPFVLRDIGTEEIYSLDWHER